MDVGGDLDFDVDDEGSAARDGPGGGLVRAAEVSLGGRFGGVLFPGGFAAAGEPVSSTAAVRQRRGSHQGVPGPAGTLSVNPKTCFATARTVAPERGDGKGTGAGTEGAILMAFVMPLRRRVRPDKVRAAAGCRDSNPSPTT